MSQGRACLCKPRNVDVVKRNCNYSAFNGYKYTPSDYSTVRCLTCGAIWRTKAAFVSSAPSAPKDWASQPHPQRPLNHGVANHRAGRRGVRP